MKNLSILYIGIKDRLNLISTEVSECLLKLFSTYGTLHLLGDLFEETSYREDKLYNLVVVQNSYSFIRYKDCIKRLRKSPVLFVSIGNQIESYVTSFENLFGVLNIGNISLSALGIPVEMQLCLNYPVEEVANWYFYEHNPKVYRIAYCPTGNSIQENDLKLISFVQRTNAFLTIVSDSYQGFADIYPSSVRVVSEKNRLSVFKKSHLVVASGQNVVRALAVCKPCVVLGDRGLGGLVTPANFEQLRSVSFSGRKGGYLGEFVPMDLLDAEIRNVFSSDSKDVIYTLCKKILALYDMDSFSIGLANEVDRIIALSTLLKSRKRRFDLKPFRSSIFQTEELEGETYIMRGLQCLGKIDDEMVRLLKQCDGTMTLSNLIRYNGYNLEDATILWENMYALWKEKLILFAL